MKPFIILFICEGDCEVAFVKDHLSNYLLDLASTLTSRPLVVKAFNLQGGISLDRLVDAVTKALKTGQYDLVTTIADLCDLKKHIDYSKDSSIDKVKQVEAMILSKVQANFRTQGLPASFIPYLSLYEFETYLFTDLNLLRSVIEDNEGNLDKPEKITSLTKWFAAIHDVNTDNNPSDRIINAALVNNKPVFSKKLHGLQIIDKIGIEAIKAVHPHFCDWLGQLEAKFV